MRLFYLFLTLVSLEVCPRSAQTAANRVDGEATETLFQAAWLLAVAGALTAFSGAVSIRTAIRHRDAESNEQRASLVLWPYYRNSQAGLDVRISF
jgi:hypothetical protein